ncbi:MAG TPA: hypothetical protein VE010_15795 [Thermoanaerobaculia bacterium]|nr:hypothetical protein [Thermoanaerobaculia bacterium]
MTSRNWIAVTGALMLSIAGADVSAQVKTAPVIRPGDAVARVAPQAQMEALAAKLGLGAKRKDSARPQPTESGAARRATGFYQCFERGCVYYSAETGVRAVTDPILTRFVADGYERGPLGFPLSDVRTCVEQPRENSLFGAPTTTAVSYQDFEGGSIGINRPGSGTATMRFGRRVGERGDCAGTGPLRPPGAARFRVSINGFAVARPTFDDAAQRDGVDDEVFIQTHAALYDLTGQHPVHQPERRTRTIGDTNGFRLRIRGGSGSSIFGGNGGFRENDTFPAGGTPWRRTAPLTDEELPLRVWEGELREGENALVMFPSIWEADTGVDENDGFNNRHLRAIAAAWSDRTLANLVLDTIRTDGPTILYGQLNPLFSAVSVATDAAGPGTRPIGMSSRGGNYAFDAKAFVLTYKTASRLAARNDNGHGPGISQVEFRDADPLRGLYLMYVQVERLP